MKFVALLSAVAFASLVSTTGSRAQSPVTTTTTTTTTFASSASQAVETAKDGVDVSLRNHIVSVYGIGTPAAIQTWWVIFYDPSVASHGRAVKVEGGQISRSYEAKGGVTYTRALTFPESRVSGEGAALGDTQNYAAQARDCLRPGSRTPSADRREAGPAVAGCDAEWLVEQRLRFHQRPPTGALPCMRRPEPNRRVEAPAADWSVMRRKSATM